MTGHGEHRREGAQDTVRPGALSALLKEIAEAPASAVEPWDSGLIPGALVGRFELVRELGRGGFGIVWEARDRELGRRVAFKAVRSGGQSDLREERLLREAEAAARLSHPNLVTLFDVGRTDQGPYLVFELLDGETLDERLAKGLIPQAEALRIGVEIAKGVAHAHAQGVVHRDLKPGNVFLCRDGQVKVLDFGMAHAFGQRWVAGGTPAYMAPEQAKGAPEDERTDVWAMGAMLFEMLSGERPFQDEKALRSSRLAPRLEVTGAPELGELVARALAKDPLARPRDAGELLAALSAIEKELIPSTGGVRTRRRPRLKLWAPIVAALALAGLAAGVGVWRRREPAARTQQESIASSVPSIAVLPFADLSPGKDQEYFADGVAEEILNALSHVEGLRVTGRTSSFSFKGKGVQIQEIGRQLNVGAVLEGSLRRDGDRVRVTAQLVNAADGYHVWSETYSRQIGGIFEVQDDIARAVVAALRVRLASGPPSAPRPRRAVAPEVYNAYLLGKHVSRQGRVDSPQRAVAAYQRALALDPDYAPAWAGLAWATFWGSESTKLADIQRDCDRALAAADKALSLDPELGEAYAIRGFLRSVIRWDWAGARADFERALRLNPGDARVHSLYGRYVLRALGHLPEAIAEAQRATELDPLDAMAWANYGGEWMAAGQLERALEAFDRSLEIQPEHAFVPAAKAMVLLRQGKLEEARAWAERNTDFTFRLRGIAMVAHSLGRAEESQRALDELLTAAPEGSAYQIAEVFAWRGEREKAFEWLERAYQQRDSGMTNVKVGPEFRNLRSDPRFSALLRKMNLPLD